MENQLTENMGTARISAASYVLTKKSAGIAKTVPFLPIKTFYSFVVFTSRCWLWSGSVNNSGYGRLYVNGSYFSAHRLSYNMFNEGIHPNLVIDHICRNKRCVNPSHLRQVTRQINATQNSISPPAKNIVKEVCINGHSFSGENLHITKKGNRACIICRRKKYRDFYYKNAEKLNAGRKERYRKARDS